MIQRPGRGAGLVLALLLCCGAAARAAEGEATGGAADNGGLRLRGSATASLGAWVEADSPLPLPGGTGPWSARARGEVRLEAGLQSRCAAEFALAVDAGSPAPTVATRELWVEWRPLTDLALRLGRQRLGFGSGLLWNPANDLEGPRDSVDPAAPRRGTDAAVLSLWGGGLLGFPLSLQLLALWPEASAGLEETRCATRLYAYLGGMELAAVASAARPGDQDAAWLLGGWATIELGPFVLGLEGAWREGEGPMVPGPGSLPEAPTTGSAALAASLNIRKGDFLAGAELLHDWGALDRGDLAGILARGLPATAAWAPLLFEPGSVGPLHASGRLAWASGDLSLQASVLADLETGDCSLRAQASMASGGEAGAVLSLGLPIVAGEDFDDDIGLSGRGLSVEALVSLGF